MKALVLAGGTGSRLRPLTHTSAKQLVPIANKPVLFYGIEALVEAGVSEIGIVTGDSAAEVEAAVGDGSRFGARVTYIPQGAPLGLAHAVLVAREWLADDDFVMYLGDNFVIGGITELVADFRAERPDARVLLTKVADPSSFGVAELDPDGHIERLEEKPRAPRSDLALVGIYLFTPAVHDAVQAIRPSARGELEITDAIQWLVEHERVVSATVITGYWKDTGSAADMLEANRSALEGLRPAQLGSVDTASQLVGPVRVEEGATVVRSRIVGPAVIGGGSVVTDSYVGPSTSVGQGCVIDGSEVEFSIVLGRARIEHAGRIAGSLIGRDAHITGAPQAPRAHCLVVGDHSRVQITS
ncbi:glucose-1-phosphate thymidylyltransferase [Streptomyces lonarensis]|uniref:Glucose-1-phosphate thymidylyltransferase n=1 Tax=Streptomyces lonarensis TaxID=700599 RepID=A0A7X6HXH8_9ACTN|nr:glucose-1-phosphate thymidylyltransferase [Streptomyces lonarensis]NJQ04199.1 glucose-1-phosphate thymidylyltransferase [Streptomyces lonarensis]